jgi:hypothetical protein
MRYYTHDNGSRPFAIDVEGGVVDVFKKTSDGGDVYTDMPIITFHPERVFIGNSPECPMTIFSGGFGSRFDGNSILLHIRNNEYVFIGSEIYKFQCDGNIVVFVSPVGNNDVPYPYSITDNGDVYLMIENVILRNFDINEHPDPYDYYYDHSIITQDNGRIPPRQPLIQNHLNITEYYLGDEPYTMRYKPNPDHEYDRVIPRLGEKMYVVIDGIRREFTKDEYINFMVEFGINAGFRYFPTDSIITRNS